MVCNVTAMSTDPSSMTQEQRLTIYRLAQRLQASDGELIRAAREVTHGEVNNLDQLGRAEADRLIVYLDQLEAVTC